MATEPKDIRLPIMVTASEAAAIDDFRFKKRINTRAEAIRLLIARGLSFDEVAEATEVAGHIGGEYLRGVEVSLGDQMSFANALITLYGAVDSADEDVEKSLTEFASKLSEKL
ncbi:hypothetical protein FY136_06100 [Agrobacterium tumefaciens]|uniref:hypothetical protein n=1 Tax=Agrobacterium tumefaciens TaxID=358 RepID=UPI0021CEF2ED|nr:hypothetical protein [Agrobacterium tumefaciens]UXT48835.1 hypothetical protein FY136_06100 [Agrobacterium tumefaciens]